MLKREGCHGVLFMMTMFYYVQKAFVAGAGKRAKQDYATRAVVGFRMSSGLAFIVLYHNILRFCQ